MPANPASSSASPAPPPLSRGALLARLALMGAIIGALVVSFAYAGGWLSPGAITSERIVDRFEHIGGLYPGFRRNHAKGVCAYGTFESNGQGVALSKAALFRSGRTPLRGRFAFSGGDPFVTDAPGLVRSLALSFELSTGEQWRTAMINIPVFPAKTPEVFYDFLLASAPDPQTGRPDPARMSGFLAANPASAEALKIIGGRSVSSGFDNTTYNALNAFLFTNRAGKTVPVRWSLVPLQAFAPASDAPSSSADTNALFDALIAAVHEHPLQWRLVVTVGEPGDPITDATVPWPADRRQVDLGVVTIDRLESEDTSPVRDITFDPLILPDGISSSGDPLLSARSATYAESFKRREGERKEPSAVSPTEVAK